jgi:hypothetical protein
MLTNPASCFDGWASYEEKSIRSIAPGLQPANHIRSVITPIEFCMDNGRFSK